MEFELRRSLMSDAMTYYIFFVYIKTSRFESLRMHPSAGLTARRTTKEVTIGDRSIPAHTILFVMTNWVHRSDEYWTNPDEFDPLRFSPERKENKNHPFCFVPFGGGAHKCIGMHVALMNAKLVLHHALKRYSFDFVPGYQPKADPLPLAMPVQRLPLVVRERP